MTWSYTNNCLVSQGASVPETLFNNKLIILIAVYIGPFYILLTNLVVSMISARNLLENLQKLSAEEHDICIYYETRRATI